MKRVTELLQKHHGACDELFAVAEAAAHAGDWAACSAALRRFHSGLEAHFVAEETILFPAFESVTGMRTGPTEMMRLEHEQMRGFLHQLASALEGRDKAAFGGAAETLLVLTGQHNMKEENILYPMCDQTLASQCETLYAALHSQLEAE